MNRFCPPGVQLWIAGITTNPAKLTGVQFVATKTAPHCQELSNVCERRMAHASYPACTITVATATSVTTAVKRTSVFMGRRPVRWGLRRKHASNVGHPATHPATLTIGCRVSIAQPIVRCLAEMRKGVPANDNLSDLACWASNIPRTTWLPKWPYAPHSESAHSQVAPAKGGRFCERKRVSRENPLVSESVHCCECCGAYLNFAAEM